MYSACLSAKSSRKVRYIFLSDASKQQPRFNDILNTRVFLTRVFLTFRNVKLIPLHGAEYETHLDYYNPSRLINSLTGSKAGFLIAILICPMLS